MIHHSTTKQTIKVVLGRLLRDLDHEKQMAVQQARFQPGGRRSNEPLFIESYRPDFANRSKDTDRSQR
jgi:hypothetical protein